jgi:protein-serine/threonine kinase
MNGTLPDSFYNLTKLKQLSISGHAFTGEIKTEIGNMANLTSFKISRNKFSGTLPSELGRCEKLGKIFMELVLKLTSFIISRVDNTYARMDSDP